MTTTGDPLLEALGTLREPSERLTDRVISRWIRVEQGPTGPVYAAWTDRGVSYLRTAEDVEDDPELFTNRYRERFERPVVEAPVPPSGLLSALRSGRTGAIPLDLRGLTEFQRQVLEATRGIPRGEFRAYGWVAAAIGRPKAVRAVGSALANNPVPLLIPCHRVTLSDASPGQYVFGAETKLRLLGQEQANLDEVHALAARGVRYLGSDSTGVVCVPSCRNARRITPGHRREFGTLRASLDAGYRACRHCRPDAALSGPTGPAGN